MATGRFRYRKQVVDGRTVRVQEQVKPGIVDWPAVQAKLREQGIVLVGGGADEAPEVYKRLPDVLAAHAGSIRVKHTLTPSASRWPVATCTIRTRTEARESGPLSFRRQPGRIRSVTMEFVDIFVNRRAAGHAYMRDDVLEGVMTPRGRRRTRLQNCDGCTHERVIGAFAHRRSRDEHWPIAYCLDCFAIVAGLDPLVRARRPRWKFDDQNLVVARWTRDWPKRGRPRSDAPSAETAWPDAA